MIGSLALLLIGVADLIRARARHRTAIGAVAAGWLILAVATVVFLGAPVWAVIASAVIAVAWLPTMTADDARRPPVGVWPAVALAVVLLILLAVDPTANALQGPLVDALDASASSVLRDTPAAVLVLVVGGATFLLESGNVITRAALHRDGFRSPEPVDEHSTPQRPRWSLSRSRTAESPAEKPIPDLRGGRAIGPLERLAIAGLVLVGAYAIVGAVLAGKGIVRFPEISKDSASGSKAEYFLVGSLTSWTIALAMAGYIALAR